MTAGGDAVEVPEEFRRIGYSGLFHLTISVENTDNAEVLEDYRVQALADRCPFLNDNPGWMTLSVDVASRTAVIVRRDSNAVAEALLRVMP